MTDVVGGFPYVGVTTRFPTWWAEGVYVYVHLHGNCDYIPLAENNDGIKVKAPLDTYGVILRSLSKDGQGWVWSIRFGLGHGVKILDPSDRLVSYVKCC